MSIVMKIGGSILKERKGFDRVVKIVNGREDKQVIVISALYGVTDSLINAAEKCVKNEMAIGETLVDLRNKHTHLLNSVKDRKIREQAIGGIEEKLAVLERFLYGVHYLGELSMRSRDLLQSFGERLSPIVLQAFLEEAGISTVFLTSEEAGIAAVGEFDKANAEMKRTKKNLQKNLVPLLKDKVILVTGFYGIDSGGNVRSFGRGGTDYTAAVVASCIGADSLEIWKDVNGFMSANPKIVKEAKRIPLLSYDEAEELGYLGAEILYPKSILPLRDAKVSAVIRNIFRPNEKGTIISKEGEKSRAVIKSIAASKNVAYITVGEAAMVNAPGVAARLFTMIANAGISINMIATSETNISFTLDRGDLKRAIKEIKSNGGEFEIVESRDDVVLLGVVGEGMNNIPGTSGKLFSCLGREKINIEMISQGASEINISFVIKEKYLDAAIRCIHKEFVEGGK
ncbi:MAG: aspartate kinase [Candidatus Diapherotrites archaeon]